MDHIPDDVVGLVSAAAEGKILNKLKSFIIHFRITLQILVIQYRFYAISNNEINLLNDILASIKKLKLCKTKWIPQNFLC